MLSCKNIAPKALLGFIGLLLLTSSITLASDYMYVKATHLNVRTAGHHKARIMAVIDSWYKVKVLESLQNKWKKVLLEDWRIGYVNGWYLSTNEPYYEKVTASRYTIKFGKAFVRWFNLIKKEAVLENWDVLEVINDKIYLNNWIQVRILNAKIARYNWRVGYIWKKLVIPIEWFAYNNDEKVNTTNESINNENENIFPLNSAPSEPINIDNTIINQPSEIINWTTNWFQWFTDNTNVETINPIIDNSEINLPLDNSESGVEVDSLSPNFSNYSNDVNNEYQTDTWIEDSSNIEWMENSDNIETEEIPNDTNSQEWSQNNSDPNPSNTNMDNEISNLLNWL